MKEALNPANAEKELLQKGQVIVVPANNIRLWEEFRGNGILNYLAALADTPGSKKSKNSTYFFLVGKTELRNTNQKKFKSGALYDKELTLKFVGMRAGGFGGPNTKVFDY
jgi:hypothetical protein